MTHASLPPARIDQMTPAFLTGRLRAAGPLSRATVTAVEAQRLGSRTRYNAQLFRLHLHYDRSELRAPRTLVAKLPTLNTALHERAGVFQPGAKENWFYQHVARQTTLPVPRCYYNALDPESGGSVLLLQDLAPAQPGDQAKGASAKDAALALQRLAPFHAAWWSEQAQRELPDFIRRPEKAGAATVLVDRLYAAAWPQFLELNIVVMPEEVRRFGASLAGRLAQVNALLAEAPQTLIHGDFRLENLLWDGAPAKVRCWVVDWEDIALASAMVDVAWFLGGGLRLAEGGRESELVRHYHQALVAGGVAGYTEAQCFAHYRLAMCGCFVQGVLMATATATISHRQPDVSGAVAERFVAACARLRLGELFPI